MTFDHEAGAANAVNVPLHCRHHAAEPALFTIPHYGGVYQAGAGMSHSMGPVTHVTQPWTVIEYDELCTW